jgi:hypothetical protein
VLLDFICNVCKIDDKNTGKKLEKFEKIPENGDFRGKK